MLCQIKELLIAVKQSKRPILVSFLFDQGFLDQMTSFLSGVFADEEELLKEITWICILVFSVSSDCDLIFDILRQTGLLVRLVSMTQHPHFEVFSNSLWALANIQNEETEYKQILSRKSFFDSVSARLEYFEGKFQEVPKTFYESYFVFLGSHFGTLPVEESQSRLQNLLVWVVQILVRPEASAKYSIDDLILETVDKLTGLLEPAWLETFLEMKTSRVLFTFLMRNLEQKRADASRVEQRILFNLTRNLSADLENYFRQDQIQAILIRQLTENAFGPVTIKLFQNVLSSEQTIDSFFQNGNEHCFVSIFAIFSEIKLDEHSEILEEMVYLLQQMLFFGQSGQLGRFVVDNLGRRVAVLIGRIP